MDYKDNFVIVHDQNQHQNSHLSPVYYQSPSPARNNRYQQFPSRQNSGEKVTLRPQSATSQRSHSYSSLYNFDIDISPIKPSLVNNIATSTKPQQTPSGTSSKPRTRPNTSSSNSRKSRYKSSKRSSKSSSSNNSNANPNTNTNISVKASSIATQKKNTSKSKIKHRQKQKHKHRSGTGSSHSLSSKRQKRKRKNTNEKSKKSLKFNYDDYEVLDTVGCGSFAKVSRVRRKSTSEIFVWKELSYGAMSDKEKQMLCDEVNILRDLNHPNIVQFVDRIIELETRKIFIVQEYCDGGDLASYIKLKKEKSPAMSGRISESFIWSVTSEIASALQHCHNHFNRHNKKTGKKRILHRDLKPGNVFLVKRRGTYSVKLGDFGLAKMLDESSIFAQTHVGTPYYMSPEQIQSKSYNEKSDIWALGCIVYEMAMLARPFKAANYLHLAEKIKLGIYKKISTRNYSEELENAIQMMLTVETNKRAKVEELLCLPRIQFTSKMLRLDRRYTQLKKKEHQFNLKMQEFENKYKRKAKQLSDKEEALKLKEKELSQKEVFLQSKTPSQTSGVSTSTNSNSGDSGHSKLSPSTNGTNSTSGSGESGPGPSSATTPSIKSNSVASSKLLTPILTAQSSPVPSSITTTDFKRTTSNGSMASMSTLNTSKTSGSSTLPSTVESNGEEKKEESQSASGNNSNDGDRDREHILLNDDNTNIPTLNENYLFHDDQDDAKSKTKSAGSGSQSRENLLNINENTSISVTETDQDATENILSDARKYLMKKVNLSDLNMNMNETNLIAMNPDMTMMTSRSFDHVLTQKMNHLEIGNNHSYSFRYQNNQKY